MRCGAPCLTKRPPDRLVEVTRNQGKGRHCFGTRRELVRVTNCFDPSNCIPNRRLLPFLSGCVQGPPNPNYGYWHGTIKGAFITSPPVDKKRPRVPLVLVFTEPAGSLRLAWRLRGLRQVWRIQLFRFRFSSRVRRLAEGHHIPIFQQRMASCRFL